MTSFFERQLNTYRSNKTLIVLYHHVKLYLQKLEEYYINTNYHTLSESLAAVNLFKKYSNELKEFMKKDLWYKTTEKDQLRINLLYMKLQNSKAILNRLRFST